MQLYECRKQRQRYSSVASSISMEDDLTFGVSVWDTIASPEGVSPIKTRLPIPQPPESSDSGFDDFEDFNTAPTSAVEAQDDFGDFEEFGESPTVTASFNNQALLRTPSERDWQSLRLDPLPGRSELEAEIHRILEPLWADEDSAVTTDDPIREIEGIAQILVTPER